MTNNEGGTNDEEFRNVAVVDRVNTTFTVWMGTSMACAQCHTHKYDPITQKEYFQVFAFLNNTADSDKSDESPTLPFWSDELLKKKADLEKQIADLEEMLKDKKPDELKPTRDKLAAIKKDLAAIKPLTTVPVMKELTGAARRKDEDSILRGNFLDLGDEVNRGHACCFPRGIPKDAPKTRLEFAKWVISEDNPLTARVIANRFWEQIFGIGIVRTSEEFGTQGELPSHPELLDWLATELANLTTKVVAHAKPWDVKKFLKLLVMSNAYRQSAKGDARSYSNGTRENRFSCSCGPRGAPLGLRWFAIRRRFPSPGYSVRRCSAPSVRPLQPRSGRECGIRRRDRLEDKRWRGQIPSWRVHTVAPIEPLSVDVHVRRAESRYVHRSPCPHEYATASARDHERPGVRGSGAGTCASHNREGREDYRGEKPPSRSRRVWFAHRRTPK